MAGELEAALSPLKQRTGAAARAASTSPARPSATAAAAAVAAATVAAAVGAAPRDTLGQRHKSIASQEHRSAAPRDTVGERRAPPQESSGHGGGRERGGGRLHEIDEEEDEGDILDELWLGALRESADDPLRLHNILRRGDASSASDFHRELHSNSTLAWHAGSVPASSHADADSFLLRPHEAPPSATALYNISHSAVSRGSSEQSEDAQKQSTEDGAVRAMSDGDALVARANALLPVRQPDSLGVLEQRVARGVGGGMPHEELLRHQGHLQQYLAHRDGQGGGAAAGEEDSCLVDLVFDQAWLARDSGGSGGSGGTGSVASWMTLQFDADGQLQDASAGESAAGRGPDVRKKAAEAVVDVGECLEVGIHRLHLVHVGSNEQRQAVVRLRVLGVTQAVESIGAGHEGVRPGQRPQEIVSRLVGAVLDASSPLRQRASMACLVNCLVHSEASSPPDLAAPSSTLAGVPWSLAGLAAQSSLQLGAEGGAGVGAAAAGGEGKRRLTASELQQRLLAEVDLLDELHHTEQQLTAMAQVTPGAARVLSCMMQLRAAALRLLSLTEASANAGGDGAGAAGGGGAGGGRGAGAGVAGPRARRRRRAREGSAASATCCGAVGRRECAVDCGAQGLAQDHHRGLHARAWLVWGGWRPG